MACAQTRPDKSGLSDLTAGIDELKYDQALLDVLTTSPQLKDCRDAGWPETDLCKNLALVVARMMQKYYVHTTLTGGTHVPIRCNKGFRWDGDDCVRHWKDDNGLDHWVNQDGRKGGISTPDGDEVWISSKSHSTKGGDPH